MGEDMYLEERIEKLEEPVKELSDKVEHLESVNHDKWVSAKELSMLMGCSTNNIYIKIRSGEIYATKKLGALPRIPLSQFYEQEQEKPITVREKPQAKQKPQRELTMKEIVFGRDYN